MPLQNIDNFGKRRIMPRDNIKSSMTEGPHVSSGARSISLEQYRKLSQQSEGSPVRNSKYNAKKTVVDGITFDSKGEAKRFSELSLLQAVGEISDLKLQQTHVLAVNGVLICKYRSDFEYITRSGDKIVEDFKGVRTQEYKIKRNLMKAILNIEILETGSETSSSKKRSQ